MFTGIIEETGFIQNVIENNLTINCNKILEDISIGDSIAVNGVCLTVSNFTENSITANVMPVTLEKSNLRNLSNSDLVNLERAMRADSRFGGHLVSGHVDSIGKIVEIYENDNAKIVTISVELQTAKYLIQEGSICIDGISLTISQKNEVNFSVSLIPYTFASTAFNSKNIGDEVNLEVDMIGKYLYHFTNKETKITRDFLAENGF